MIEKSFVPVMLTPFQEGGAIDFEALEELIDFYLEAGARGLFANCLSSEMYDLSEQERLDLVRFVVEKVAGRVPVVATGTFPGELSEQAAFCKAMYATGVESVIVITGLLAEEEEGEEVFRARVRQLMETTEGVPLGFYECPVPYKRLLAPEFLGELAKTGRVYYHKDTCLDLEEIKAKLSAAEGVFQFKLYDAYMAHAVASLRAGSTGLSCIQGNYFPELVVWLCQNYQKDTPELGAAQAFFVQHMDVMHATYPASAKYILQKRGLSLTRFCRNGSQISPNTEALDALYQSYKDLRSQLQF